MVVSARFRGFRLRRPRAVRLRGVAPLLAALWFAAAGAALAQTYDCAGLQAKIAELDRSGGGRGPGPSRQQLGELNGLIATARSLSCDQPPYAWSGRCPGLNAQIRALQDQVGQARARGGEADRAAARVELVARYNTYCRNQPPQPRQRGFFEQLFGIPAAPETPPQPAAPMSPEEAQRRAEEADPAPRGGSQALCVRTCDGGFFPLGVSARNADPAQLHSLCQALCPNAEVAVYTRSPSRPVETSVSLDGAPYSEMPNAGKFEKTFDPACTCKPPGQSWVEALSGADGALRALRKGDIIVTPEKSAEMSAPSKPAASRPKPDAAPAADPAADPAGGDGEWRETTGPDGVRRRVRVVGPTL
ncbi:DUF2865 domain-containing protein [Methylocella sp.]|uniref:DUF2865 domain-containing protein n=1 Tax=Methylocella sp. TaxID=1978226 RepID=UPI0037831E36